MSITVSSAVSDEQRHRIDWLLKRLAGQLPTIAHAVAVSADGLCTAHTDSLGTDRADQFSAAVSGLVSLGRGVAGVLETGDVDYTMLTMTGGTVVVLAVCDGSSLAALAHPDCDVSAVAHQMAVIANQIGAIVTPPARTAVAGP